MGVGVKIGVGIGVIVCVASLEDSGDGLLNKATWAIIMANRTIAVNAIANMTFFMFSPNMANRT